MSRPATVSQGGIVGASPTARIFRSVRGAELSPVLWLAMPIAILLSPYLTKNFTPDFFHNYMNGEQGVIENLTVVLLVAAIGYGIAAWRRAAVYPAAWFKTWIALFVLGCIYYAGEEISWGQHYLHWSTPSYWQAINDQNETNLHNTGLIFDQIPRNLLTLAALVGGVIAPAFVRPRRNWRPDQIQDWLWPTYVCIPSAFLAVVIQLPAKAFKAAGTDLPDAFNIVEGELKECLLAAFLLTYIASVAVRAKKHAR